MIQDWPVWLVGFVALAIVCEFIYSTSKRCHSIDLELEIKNKMLLNRQKHQELFDNMTFFSYCHAGFQQRTETLSSGRFPVNYAKGSMKKTRYHASGDFDDVMESICSVSLTLTLLGATRHWELEAIVNDDECLMVFRFDEMNGWEFSKYGVGLAEDIVNYLLHIRFTEGEGDED